MIYSVVVVDESVIVEDDVGARNILIRDSLVSTTLYMFV